MPSIAVSPSMPGSLTSMKTRSGWPVRAASMPFSPVAAARNSWPMLSTSLRKTQTMESSSSTTSTLAMRELDPERGSAGRRVVPDRAAVILDDALRQRQAQPDAVLLGGDEGLEHLRAQLRGDARAAIGHRKAGAALARPHPDLQRPARRHRLGAVEHQVHH